jgi:hypothetical protein
MARSIQTKAKASKKRRRSINRKVSTKRKKVVLHNLAQTNKERKGREVDL